MTRYVIRTARAVDDLGLAMGPYAFEAVDDDLFDLPWLHGVQISAPVREPIEVTIDTEDRQAGFFADYVSGSLPMVSDRLRRAFEAAGIDTIQYFRAVLLNASAFKSVPDYWVFNVVGRVAVSDDAGSRATHVFGVPGATTFNTFKPHPELERSPACFRSLERATTVVVSEAVKAACVASGISTVEFTPLEEWFR